MSTPMPSVSAQLKEMQDLVLPLIVPPASAFTTPLLNSFASSHDPLMDSDALFTAKSDLGNAQIELNAALRALARNAAADESDVPDVPGPDAGDPASDAKQLLEKVRQARLRSRLRGIAGGAQPAGDSAGEAPPRSHVSITRASRLRKEAFDREIEGEESAALEDFKQRLRQSVLET
ncbi:hypothetical protein Dda_2828 [Drechslerella dactyloides]|uniref:Uncharacterized protein n=1 Tax=Drechslerella dactyloides TaxID=74499 RepID=A0AAD6J0R0_DREDA|nr:hypothetical protein Dda_2828 [Drechslerella dactyloides]